METELLSERYVPATRLNGVMTKNRSMGLCLGSCYLPIFWNYKISCIKFTKNIFNPLKPSGFFTYRQV